MWFLYLQSSVLILFYLIVAWGFGVLGSENGTARNVHFAETHAAQPILLYKPSWFTDSDAGKTYIYIYEDVIQHFEK